MTFYVKNKNTLFFILFLSSCMTRRDTGYQYTCESHCWYVCNQSYTGPNGEDTKDPNLYRACTEACPDAPESNAYTEECTNYITTTKQTLEGE